jgi:hypothetical protein
MNGQAQLYSQSFGYAQLTNDKEGTVRVIEVVASLA